MNIECVILASGLGSRLKSVTKDIPKCLVTLNNKTLLELTLDSIIESIPNANIYVTVALQDFSYFQQELHRLKKIKEIKLIVQPEANGTLNAIHLVKPSLNSGLCVVLGDIFVKKETFFDAIQMNFCNGYIGCSRYNKENYQSTVVEIDGNNIIRMIEGKKSDTNYRWTGRIYFPPDCELKKYLLEIGIHAIESPNIERNISKFLHQVETPKFRFFRAIREQEFVNINTPNDYIQAGKIL